MMVQQNVQTTGEADNLASEANAALLNLGEGVGGLNDALDEFAGKTVGQNLTNTVVKVDKAFQQVANTMGQGANLSEAIKMNLADSSLEILKAGGKLERAGEIMNETLEVYGKNVTLGADQVTNLFMAEKATGVAAKSLVEGFANAGMSIKNINKEMSTVLDVSNALGVNSKAVSSAVVGNLDKLNRFGFQGGVEGLARMAAKAQALRVSMESTFQLADKLLDPEQAIELSSTLQRLGATTSSLVDPLRLMDLAQNNVPELQKQLGDLFKNYTYFDEKTKSFQIMPSARRDLKALEQSLGIPLAEIEKMALGTADLDKKLSEISFAGFNIDKDTQELIANMSTMTEGGEYKIQTEEIVDGKPVFKSIQDIIQEQGGDSEKIKEYLTGIQKEEGKSVDDKIYDTALKQLDQLSAIRAGRAAAKAAPGLGAATTEFGEELFAVNKSVGDGINSRLIEALGPTSAFQTTLKEVGGSIKEARQNIEKELSTGGKIDFGKIGETLTTLSTNVAKQITDGITTGLSGVGIDVNTLGDQLKDIISLPEDEKETGSGGGTQPTPKRDGTKDSTGGDGTKAGSGGGTQPTPTRDGKTGLNEKESPVTITTNEVLLTELNPKPLEFPNIDTIQVTKLEVGESNLTENLNKAVEQIGDGVKDIQQTAIDGIEQAAVTQKTESETTTEVQPEKKFEMSVGPAEASTESVGPYNFDEFTPVVDFMGLNKKVSEEVTKPIESVVTPNLLTAEAEAEEGQGPIAPVEVMSEESVVTPNLTSKKEEEEKGDKDKGGFLSGLFNMGDVVKNAQGLAEMNPETIATIIESAGEKVAPELLEISKIEDKGEQTKALQELMDKVLTAGNALDVLGTENKYEGKLGEGAGINEGVTAGLKNIEGLNAENIGPIVEMFNSNMSTMIDSVAGKVKDVAGEDTMIGKLGSKFGFDPKLIDEFTKSAKEIAEGTDLDAEQISGVFEGKTLDVFGSMGQAMEEGLYSEGYGPEGIAESMPDGKLGFGSEENPEEKGEKGLTTSLAETVGEKFPDVDLIKVAKLEVGESNLVSGINNVIDKTTEKSETNQLTEISKPKTTEEGQDLKDLEQFLGIPPGEIEKITQGPIAPVEVAGPEGSILSPNLLTAEAESEEGQGPIAPVEVAGPEGSILSPNLLTAEAESEEGQGPIAPVESMAEAINTPIVELPTPEIVQETKGETKEKEKGGFFNKIGNVVQNVKGLATMDESTMASLISAAGEDLIPQLGDISKMEKGDQKDALKGLIGDTLSPKKIFEILGTENTFKGKVEEGGGINAAMNAAITENKDLLEGVDVGGITSMLSDNLVGTEGQTGLIDDVANKLKGFGGEGGGPLAALTQNIDFSQIDEYANMAKDAISSGASLDTELIGDIVSGEKEFNLDEIMSGTYGETAQYEQEPLTVPEGEYANEQSPLTVPDESFVGTEEPEFVTQQFGEEEPIYNQEIISASVPPIPEIPMPASPIMGPYEDYDSMMGQNAGVESKVSESKEVSINFNVAVDFKNAPNNIDPRAFSEQLKKEMKDLPFIQELGRKINIGSDITNDYSKNFG
jgi:hypothetical protein